MRELKYSHGSGRLRRTPTALAFSVEPNDGLFELIHEADAVDFKALASLVVTADFSVPPFIVLDIPSGKAFVFGEIVVDAGETTLDGSTTTTWIEHTVDLSSTVHVGEVSAPDGALDAGWVSAQSFVFGSPTQETLLPESSPSDDVTPSTEGAPLAEPAPEFGDTPEPDPPEPETPGEPQPMRQNVPSAPAVVVELPAEQHEPDPPAAVVTSAQSDDWDPLADPDVNLESIGSAEIIDAPAPPPPPPLVPSPERLPAHEPTTFESGPDNFIPDDTVDNKTPDPVADFAPQPRGLSQPPPPSGAPVPPPPSPPPPLRPLDTKSDPTLPAPPDLAAPPPPPAPIQAGRHSLRFDDGQYVEISTGAYVGRHPTKNGVPDRYKGVTIRGEHVSRVHWELAVESGVAIVRDLGSNSGTEVEINGRRIEVPTGGTQITPGATIHFADRWANYESE